MLLVALIVPLLGSLIAITIFQVGMAEKQNELSYRFEFPTEYSIQMLVHPCKFSSKTDCCNQSYGAMEYFPPIEPIEVDIAEGQFEAICQYEGSQQLDCMVDANNEAIGYNDLRTPDLTIALDSACLGEGDPRYDCYGFRTKRQRFQVEDNNGFKTIYPECIDNNDTITLKTTSCSSIANTEEESYCLDLAFAQNAFVFQCRGEYEADPTCGTFIELHRADRGEEEDINQIISETKVQSGLHSGFNIVQQGISLRFSINGSTSIEYVDPLAGGAISQQTMLICRGEYELWWVLRTRFEAIVQYIKKFRVTSPTCDWDLDTSDYLPYTLERNLI
jgi:hypothetical protein